MAEDDALFEAAAAVSRQQTVDTGGGQNWANAALAGFAGAHLVAPSLLLHRKKHQPSLAVEVLGAPHRMWLPLCYDLKNPRWRLWSAGNLEVYLEVSGAPQRLWLPLCYDLKKNSKWRLATLLGVAAVMPCCPMVMGAPPSSGRSLRGGSFRCLNLGPTERRASGSPRRRSSGGACACGRRGWAWRFPALLPRARVRRPSSSHRSPSALTTNPSECLVSVTLGAQLLAAPPSSWHLRDRPRKVVGHRTLYRTRAARVGKASAGAAKATSATAARRR